MKKIVVLSILFTLLFSLKSSAQVYSPQLIGHYGERIIYHYDGYYQGTVANGVANGIGTYYYQDGSFFRGNFTNGWWNGEGIIVTPYNGYIAGCWSYGNYIGDCPNYNYYNSNNRVERIVSEVQNERPNNSNYTAISPEGYKIKRINPDTQMGRTLLGNYSGN